MTSAQFYALLFQCHALIALILGFMGTWDSWLRGVAFLAFVVCEVMTLVHVHDAQRAFDAQTSTPDPQ